MKSAFFSNFDTYSCGWARGVAKLRYKNYIKKQQFIPDIQIMCWEFLCLKGHFSAREGIIKKITGNRKIKKICNGGNYVTYSISSYGYISGNSR